MRKTGPDRMWSTTCLKSWPWWTLNKVEKLRYNLEGVGLNWWLFQNFYRFITSSYQSWTETVYICLRHIWKGNVEWHVTWKLNRLCGFIVRKQVLLQLIKTWISAGLPFKYTAGVPAVSCVDGVTVSPPPNFLIRNVFPLNSCFVKHLNTTYFNNPVF